jgi:hypothetical protein
VVVEGDRLGSARPGEADRLDAIGGGVGRRPRPGPCD